MNDFAEDDAYQRSQRDSILVPLFYKAFFDGRYRLCDGDMEFQKRGIDTVISTPRGNVTVDEKIVRKLYAAFALETRSCTVPGYEKPGWMFYGEADRLLYCFPIEHGLDCWWIDFPALQNWFWPLEQEFPAFEMQTNNRTFGRVVNIDRIPVAKVHMRNFQLNTMENSRD